MKEKLEDLQYIGVTGFTSPREVSWMTEALDGHLGMYGVLATPETIAGKEPHKGRYARKEDLPRLFGCMPADSIRALHYCPRGMLTAQGVIEAVSACGSHMNAVQLNTGEWPSVNLIKTLKYGRLSKTGMIFQVGPGMLADKRPSEVAELFYAYDDVVDYILLDGSGGRGIPLESSWIAEAIEELRKIGISSGVTVAGGLEASTLHRVEQLVKDYHVSIDAESKLLDGNDRLHEGRLKGYVTVARGMMEGEELG